MVPDQVGDQVQVLHGLLGEEGIGVPADAAQHSRHAAVGSPPRHSRIRADLQVLGDSQLAGDRVPAGVGDDVRQCAGHHPDAECALKVGPFAHRHMHRLGRAGRRADHLLVSAEPRHPRHLYPEVMTNQVQHALDLGVVRVARLPCQFIRAVTDGS